MLLNWLNYTVLLHQVVERGEICGVLLSLNLCCNVILSLTCLMRQKLHFYLCVYFCTDQIFFVKFKALSRCILIILVWWSQHWSWDSLQRTKCVPLPTPRLCMGSALTSTTNIDLLLFLRLRQVNDLKYCAVILSLVLCLYPFFKLLFISCVWAAVHGLD